jgi:ADP-heptose:LPS heptosyltransferase
MSAAPRRILLLQHHHLGDVILTTPAIRAVRAAFPDATIDFVTSALGAQALSGNPHLDQVLVRAKLWRVFRSRYDTAIDFHSVPRTARVVAVTRARYRIGLRGRGPRNLAYTTLLPREKNAVYMGLQKLRMVGALGVAVNENDLALDLTLSSSDKSWAAQQFEKLELNGAPVVAVSPVAKHAFKQWGAQNWAEVADALANRGARILITSGPGERDQALAVAELMKNSSVWEYEQTSVKQLGAMYERCSLWIGNDGGAKHIAAAVRTPTLALYRRTLGEVWSDVRPGSDQHVINARSNDVSAIQRARVIDSALSLFARYTVSP